MNALRGDAASAYRYLVPSWHSFASGHGRLHPCAIPTVMRMRCLNLELGVDGLSLAIPRPSDFPRMFLIDSSSSMWMDSLRTRFDASQ
ncbi:hypothetical protein MSAN_02510200 [Mycena sanguinolenta]|uniref:Uncharacterized protein n=1 Tax=Mycena sanguinolenta TaxID=230812 RepID=A0A8H6WPU9_9AGAR|nr:hypothetical protein MSAN_02510200 [Mycena sanguinolenta]